MTQPAVTVVIPTHNRPDLMKRAVRSVIDQDFSGEVQIIVVFDACEPVLPEVTLAANQSMVGVPNSRSRGLAGARNTGILLADHEFVAFLDDDDYWLADKLRSQIDTFSNEPQALLVGTAMRVSDGVTSHTRLLPGTTVTHAQLLANRLPALHSSSFLFRRDALLGPIGLIDENLPRSYGEDYDILLRAAAIEPIRVVNSALVDVSWGGQSHFFGQWALYAEALQYLLRKHPGFATRRRAIGRIEAQVAFALAASGDEAGAQTWVRRSLSHDPRQVKAMLALAVSLRLVRASSVTRVANRLGRGI